MKKYILTVVAVLSAFIFISCEKNDDSPIIEFQDENFLKALLSSNNTLINNRYNVSADLNGDSKISEYEASQVLAMKYDEFEDFGEFGSTDKISSMPEIEYFISLQSLNVDNNNLTILDLSHNAAISSVSCKNNKLEELNVDRCTNLTAIDCGYNNLTSLSLQKCNRLKDLNCAGNQIKSLNVSECSDLSVLDCSSNGLISLDISKCKKLTAEYDIEENLIKQVYISAWQVKRPIIVGYHGINELYPDCEKIIKE